MQTGISGLLINYKRKLGQTEIASISKYNETNKSEVLFPEL